MNLRDSGKRSILAIIPARAGSKGLPGKNWKPLLGKPLIEYSLQGALESEYIGNILVSSDSSEIESIVTKHENIIFDRRPKELSTDSASMSDLLSYILKNHPNYDHFILLQPTSPLRTSREIDEATELYFNTECQSCVSLSQSKSINWMFQIDCDSKLIKPQLLFSPDNRQLQGENYVLNGAIYVFSRSFFMKNKKLISDGTVGYVMPRSSSIDIDDEDDWNMAEYYLERRMMK